MDLHFPNMLQKKYLSLLKVPNLKFLSCLEYENWKLEITNVDYVISNYAFSEFSSDWAFRYLDLVIRKAKHGFFQFNSDENDGSLIRKDELLYAIKSPYTEVQDPGEPINVGFTRNRTNCKLIEF